MTTLGFGQSVGQIVQMAYVVEDMRAAIDWWVRDCHVGPWFLIERFSGPGQLYRGRPATAAISLAMSFAGHMNIELLQPLDDQPSVFKEVVDRRGYGFHHVGIAAGDVDIERAATRHAAIASRSKRLCPAAARSITSTMAMTITDLSS